MKSGELMNFRFKTLLIAILVVPALLLAQQVNAQDQDNGLKPLPEGTIQYSYVDLPYADMIKSYAKKASLDMTFVADSPDGNFKFTGNREMNYLDAMDMLNEQLILKKRILIRKEAGLFLYDLEQGIPESMIPTITVGEMANRGRYEVVRCEFDVTGLDANDLRNQIIDLVATVHQSKILPIASANLLIVQESVGKLRKINNYIQSAKKLADDWDIAIISLEYALPEDVIEIATQTLRLNESGAAEDNSLNLIPHRNGDKIIASGKPAQIRKVRAIVAEVDKDAPDADSALPAATFFSYPIDGDVVKVHEVLQSMLAGRNINLDLDLKSNRINLFGRPDDHAATREIIGKVSGASGNFAIIPLAVLDPDDAKEKIEDAFGIGDTEDEDAPTITILEPNRLVVRGNPSAVAEIRAMLSEIDSGFERKAGSRTVRRNIVMSESEKETFMQALGEELPSYDLPNLIEVVEPNSRWKYNPAKREFDVYREEELQNEAEQRNRDATEQGSSSRSESSGSGSKVEAENNGQGSGQRNGGDKSKSDGQDTNETTRFYFAPPRTIVLQQARPVVKEWSVTKSSRSGVRTASYQQETQEDTNGSGMTSQETAEVIDEIESVPGAPVKIFITSRGVIIQTKDLDAGDLLEDLVMSTITTSSTEERMVLFKLKHREAAEAKSQLERYLGISGGGGGAAGGLAGGFLRNALPGAAGELAGGLLGGGGASSAPIRELAGDVTIVADPKHYTLLVSALGEDMDLVTQLVDEIDKPGADQNVNPNGETRLIYVQHVDPVEMESKVRTHFQALLENSQGGDQGGGANAQARIQQQVLQNVLGGGGSNAEIEAPKAALSVDTRNRALVVTGPRFIYEMVNRFVAEIDNPITATPQQHKFMEIGGIEVETLLQMLTEIDPNIEIMPEDSATPATPAANGGPAAANGRRNGILGGAAGGGGINQLLQGLGGGARGGRGGRGGRTGGGGRGRGGAAGGGARGGGGGAGRGGRGGR